MSKYLNRPLALGILLIGLFSANFSQAQINAYWDVNGTTNGQGGSGTWSTSGVLWTTNDVNATANTGGPSGGGLFSITNGAGAGQSGNYIINFGGTAGNVKQGGSYGAVGINFLTTGYVWYLDGTGTNARTITTSNGVNINGNVLTISNGTTGTNSFTFAAAPGPAILTSNMTSTNFVITGTGGGGLTLKNYSTSATNPFGVYVQGSTTRYTNIVGGVTNVFTNIVVGSISSNAPITVDIGVGSKIMLGTQSSQGGQIDAAIINSSASGVALNLTNSASGTISFNGVISGTNGLVLNNASSGKIALNGANTYEGETTVNSTASGNIALGTSTALGTGTVTISTGSTAYLRTSANALDFANAVNIGTGASLQLSSGNSNHKTTWSGVISGAGGINYNFKDEGLYLTGIDSSFGGGVTVTSSGTLFVNKLGMAGFNSSIGTNRAITISSSGANAPTIRWRGSADETSDKEFALTTTSSAASAGVTILADGATNATLTLNGNINSTGINKKIITLAGYNTNTLILNGRINETATYTNSVVIGASSSGTVVLGNTNNSFSGGVSIVQSTAFQSTVLQTAQIGSNGVNSTLGKNGTINIGSSDKDRVTALRYVGAGETSDKVINLSGTTGGAILEQAGTGNLKFTSAMTATGLGAKAITLQGSTAGTGELVGAISDLGGNVISLNKYGSGDWTLSGNNSYSGLTTVSGAGSLMKLMATGALSANTSLAGENSLSSAGTIDFGVGGSYTAKSYGTLSDAGNNMYFTNSSGNAVTLTFTNANNYVTASTGGGRTLINSSSNLNLDFDGNIEIGSTAINTTTFRGAGSFNVDGNLLDTGTGGIRTLQKDGEGTLTLRGGTNNYRGSTLVQTGTLDLYGNITASTNIVVSTDGTVSAGSTTRTAIATLDVKSGATLLNSSTTTVWSRGNLIVNGTAGAVVLESNGLLGGSGSVGAITGAGTVGPGNSPGILTATSVNPTAGTDFNFEFTALSPTYTSATDSGNDLLHLTAASPFAGGTFASGNIVSIYLNSAAINSSLLAGTSTTFSGGFFVDGTYALASALTSASFAYYTTSAALGTGSVVDYNGTNYYLMDGFAAKVTLSDTAVTNAGFATGTISSGTLLTFNAVPEPSTGSMLGLGLAGLVVTRLLRRKIS